MSQDDEGREGGEGGYERRFAELLRRFWRPAPADVPPAPEPADRD